MESEMGMQDDSKEDRMKNIFHMSFPITHFPFGRITAKSPRKREFAKKRQGLRTPFWRELLT